uniref:Uncharacterized protein n=1 Tax=Vespula pensylvanica TaxID=30213 RepID=A0A834NYN6_VESPE|nr:hypothetical protein H0235_009347 [Vespula pensylvanica]
MGNEENEKQRQKVEMDDCFPRKRYQAKRIPGVPACDPAIWLASARLHGNSPEIGAQSQSSPRNSPEGCIRTVGGGDGGGSGDRDRDEGGGSDGGDRGGSEGGVGGGGDGFVFRAYGKMVDHVFGVATDALVTAVR